MIKKACLLLFMQTILSSRIVLVAMELAPKKGQLQTNNEQILGLVFGPLGDPSECIVAQTSKKARSLILKMQAKRKKYLKKYMNALYLPIGNILDDSFSKAKFVWHETDEKKYLGLAHIAYDGQDKNKIQKFFLSSFELNKDGALRCHGANYLCSFDGNPYYLVSKECIPFFNLLHKFSFFAIRKEKLRLYGVTSEVPCSIFYSGNFYFSLLDLISFPHLFKAMIATKCVNTDIARTNLYLDWYAFDMSNIIIPDNYAHFCEHPLSSSSSIKSFKDLPADLQSAIKNRYQEQNKK